MTGFSEMPRFPAVAALLLAIVLLLAAWRREWEMRQRFGDAAEMSHSAQNPSP